ncbi:MAG TPA: hypothetical protein ENN29_08070 [Candidatus Hydrogenedentes bacterium]|nr:hypothetical protein [Candidatus Hydrogenedentota bacterium]
MPKRTWYLRVTEPEKNTFLLAPLAKSAGGTQACGEAVFRDKSDPDYQRLLATFQPIRDLLAGKPRFDMMTPKRQTPLIALLRLDKKAKTAFLPEPCRKGERRSAMRYIMRLRWLRNAAQNHSGLKSSAVLSPDISVFAIAMACGPTVLA